MSKAKLADQKELSTHEVQIFANEVCAGKMDELASICANETLEVMGSLLFFTMLDLPHLDWLYLVDRSYSPDSLPPTLQRLRTQSAHA